MAWALKYTFSPEVLSFDTVVDSEQIWNPRAAVRHSRFTRPPEANTPRVLHDLSEPFAQGVPEGAGTFPVTELDDQQTGLECDSLPGTPPVSTAPPSPIGERASVSASSSTGNMPEPGVAAKHDALSQQRLKDLSKLLDNDEDPQESAAPDIQSRDSLQTNPNRPVVKLPDGPILHGIEEHWQINPRSKDPLSFSPKRPVVLLPSPQPTLSSEEWLAEFYALISKKPPQVAMPVPLGGGQQKLKDQDAASTSSKKRPADDDVDKGQRKLRCTDIDQSQ